MNEQVIEKLKKILRLADNEAATQGEIEAAMGRAKEIAMQHNIDLSMLDFSDPKAKASAIETDAATVEFGTSRESACHRFISLVIKKVFGVFIVRVNPGGHPAYCFIGEKGDIAIAKEIFPWLESVFMKTLRAKVKIGQIRQCAGDRNGFYHGMAEGLIEVNVRTVKETLAKQHVDANKYAIVLRNKDIAIQEAVVRYFPRLTKSHSTRTAGSPSAQDLGRREGRTITLRQTGGGTARQALR
jgi:hypothetical protein